MSDKGEIRGYLHNAKCKYYIYLGETNDEHLMPGRQSMFTVVDEISIIGCFVQEGVTFECYWSYIYPGN